MKKRRFTEISARKLPRQARSARLVQDVLEAATRVLTRDGVHGFTAGKVAEQAGVSVGSLYQYFPNKEAILFRLQTDEWRRTGAMMERIMDDSTQAPAARLRHMVNAFFRSEWDEAALRTALGDAAPAYRDSPQVATQRRAGRHRALEFMAELLPGASPRAREFAGDLVLNVMSAVGKNVSERARSAAEVEVWSEAVGDMLCAYLERAGGQMRRAGRAG